MDAQKTQAEKLLQTLIDINPEKANSGKYKVVNFSKSFGSWDELFSSPEYAELWKGFQGAERSASITKSHCEFIGAYKEDVDPEKNYGRSFRLWKHYKADGLTFLNEISIHSALTSAPFREVIVCESSALFTNTYYRKDEQARKILRTLRVTLG